MCTVAGKERATITPSSLPMPRGNLSDGNRARELEFSRLPLQRKEQRGHLQNLPGHSAGKFVTEDFLDAPIG